jgi:hypothetical protein
MLLSLDYKYMIILRQNTENSTIVNMPFRVSHITFYKISPYLICNPLQSIFAIHYNLYFEKGQILYSLYFSLIRRYLSHSIVTFVTHREDILAQRINDEKYCHKCT